MIFLYLVQFSSGNCETIFIHFCPGLQALGENFLPNFHRNFTIKIIEKKSWQKLANKNRKTDKNKYSKRSDFGIQKGHEGTRKLGGEGIELAEIAKVTRNFGSLYVSWNLPTYPSPMTKFCPK